MSDQIPHLLRRDSNGLESRSIQSEHYWVIPLYGDLSDRMASLVAALGHRHEVYSIGESFVDLSGIREDMTERAHIIRARVLQWVGIPCGVGIAPTKTLAKLANHVAKTAERKRMASLMKQAQLRSMRGYKRSRYRASMPATTAPNRLQREFTVA